MLPCSQRDQRRRRLLADDRSNEPDDCCPHDPQPTRRWEYSSDDSSFLQHQLRCLDLVPRRWITFGLLLLAGGIIVAGLEAAYFELSRRVAPAGATVATALDIAAKGSLACWFSSLLLLAASIAALLVYSVRKHRADDYEGRYRVWLWAAGCCLFAATDQAASLREAFRDGMSVLSGTRLVGDGSLWWAAIYLIVLAAIGSRLVADMRKYRLSTAVLLAAAVAHAVAVASRFGWIGLSAGTREIMLRAGSEMAGNVLLLAAMGLHARWVVLDAEREFYCGTDPSDEPEEQGNQRASNSFAAERSTRIDPPHAAPQSTYPRASALSPPEASASRNTSAAAIPAVDRKLTKGERRALKERLLRERQQRERQP
jgi:hypothetical protein